MKALVDKAHTLHRNNTPHSSFPCLVTPSQAQEILESFNYSKQRTLNIRHAGVLAEAIRRDEFRPYTPIDFAVLNGRPNLINGQHTLTGIVMSDKPIWLDLKLIRVGDQKEIESLYSKHDIGRNRSIRDSIGSLVDETGLSKSECTAIAAAVKLINDNFRVQGGNNDAARHYEQRDHEFVKDLVRDWADEAGAYVAAINSAARADRTRLMRAGVLAVALVTLRYTPEQAMEFWSAVALDDGLNRHDPRKTLLTWLRENTTSVSQKQDRAAAACWNAWSRGKPALQKVHVNKAAPIEIHGTPYDGTKD